MNREGMCDHAGTQAAVLPEAESMGLTEYLPGS